MPLGPVLHVHRSCCLQHWSTSSIAFASLCLIVPQCLPYSGILKSNTAFPASRAVSIALATGANASSTSFFFFLRKSVYRITGIIKRVRKKFVRICVRGNSTNDGVQDSTCCTLCWLLLSREGGRARRCGQEARQRQSSSNGSWYGHHDVANGGGFFFGKEKKVVF